MSPWWLLVASAVGASVRDAISWGIGFKKQRAEARNVEAAADDLRSSTGIKVGEAWKEYAEKMEARQDYLAGEIRRLELLLQGERDRHGQEILRLTARVSMLEDTLRENGIAIPPQIQGS